MGTFLGCLFALFIGLIFFVWVLLNQGLRFIFSLLGIKLPDATQSAQQRSQHGARSHQGGQQSQQYYSSSQQSEGGNSSPNGKIFKKDESEYVEFEDVP